MKIRKYINILLALLLAFSLSVGSFTALADEDEQQQEQQEQEKEEDEQEEQDEQEKQEQVDNDQDQIEVDFNEAVNNEVEVLNMTVDEETIVSYPSALWYGISAGSVGAAKNPLNVPWQEKAGIGPDGQKLNEKFIESFKNFKGTLASARYGGTYFNYWDWKNQAMVKNSDRKAYNPRVRATHAGEENDASTVIDFCKTFLAINEDMNFYICVNMTSDTEIDVADLVEFLEGDGITNHNGGENWAQRRIAMGLKEPLKNVCYELGNEIEYKGNGLRRDWTKENYVAVARRFIAAIRSVNEDARISAVTPCSVWGRSKADWAEWHRHILFELGDQIDSLDYHSYKAYRQTNVSATTVKSIMEDIKNATGSNRIKILESESGGSSNTGKKYGWTSLAYGLSLSDYYFRIMNISEGVYEAGQLHGTMNDIDETTTPNNYSYHNVMQQWDGSLINPPGGEARDFLIRFGAGEALKTTLDGFVTERPSWVSGAVVRQEDGKLNVLLTNMSEVNDYYIDFTFGGKYKLVYSYIMTAPKLSSVVWRDKNGIINEIEITETDHDTDELMDKYLLKSKSLVCLQLEPVNG